MAMITKLTPVVTRSFLTDITFTRKGICNKLSTKTNILPSKIYELRVYISYPKDHKKVLTLFDEYIHLRVKHSKLFGFWSTEIGSSIFQIIHLWEYDSLSHRRQARNSLLQDTAWQSDFMPQLIPCMQSMTNSLVALAPGAKVNVAFNNDPKAVYELQTVEWKDVNYLPPEVNKTGSLLVGNFRGVLGPTQTEYRLWRYADIDVAFTETWKRQEASPERGTSLLLYPVKFSPIS